MKPRTRSALAPTYTVDTRTMAISLRGYCLTLRERTDCSPAIRITRLTTIASTGRLMKRSVNRIGCSSVVFRPGRRIVAGLYGVVDEHGGPVPQLEHARRHDLVPRIDARQDGHLVAARRAGLDELLADSAIRLAVLRFHLGDDEDRIAVRRVTDRRRRQGDDLLAGAERNLRLDEHARPQPAARIRERRLHLDVPGRLVNH